MNELCLSAINNGDTYSLRCTIANSKDHPHRARAFAHIICDEAKRHQQSGWGRFTVADICQGVIELDEYMALHVRELDMA